MRIGFYLPRTNYLVHYGPLIDYYLLKGEQVTIYCDLSQGDMGYKRYLRVKPEQIKDIFQQAKIFSFNSFSFFLKNIELDDIIFFLSFNNNAALQIKKHLGTVRKSPVLAVLQTGFDLMGGDNIECYDAVLVFNDNWKNWWSSWLRNKHNGRLLQDKNILVDIGKKAVSCGCVMLDQIKSYDCREIYVKYGLPDNKKIILFFPFPWRVPFEIWSHIIYPNQLKFIKVLRLLLRGESKRISDVFRMADDLQVCKAIRSFADKNGAFFAVKARRKNKVPRYVFRLADKVLYDESYYPYTTTELLKISALSVSFYSDVIKESIFCGAPTICLGPSDEKDWMCYYDRFFIKDFSRSSGSYYNFNEAVYHYSVDEFVSFFPAKSIDHFSLNSRNKRQFIDKFLGYDDYCSCKRIEETLQNMFMK